MLKNTKDRQKDYSLQKKAAEKILIVLVFVMVLFVLVSFCTDKTGTIGRKTAGFLTNYAGGALVIPLCFIIYVCICRVFSKEIPNCVRQTAATLLLYLAASAVLGIKELTGGESAVYCLKAGETGHFIAEKAFGTLGAFGTLLAGVVCMYIIFLLYGLPVNRCIKNCAAVIWTKFSGLSGKEKKNSEDNDSAKAAIEDPFAEELVLKDEIKPKRTHRKKENAAEVQEPNFDLGALQVAEEGIFPPPPEIFGPEETHDNELKPERCMPLGEKMIKALDEFGVQAELADILVGPTVIQFRITLGSGIRTSRVATLSNDIALALAVPSIRIETPVPGTSYVGIEIPNPHRRGIPMRTMIEDDSYRRTKYALPMPFGVTVSGESTVIGLETLPHLLVAGTTGSGKSVFINSCIVGLCSHCTPDELRLILVDPKRVEFAVYDNLPHLLTPPVASPKKAVHTLAWAVNEMERRFSDFESARVRNLEAFNARPNLLPKDKKPHIVIIVDELADLMMTASKEVEDYIVRLAQKARAAGIHLILATQRPSVNVITGLIKANIPARVAFSVATGIDSRTIIDGVGAEKLLGKGDMLFLSTKNPKPVRIQSPWIADDILENWLQYMNSLFGDPVFFEDVEAHSAAANTKDGTYDDDMLEQAVEYILESGIASASNLQRRLRVGFSRASRLLDMMEQLGIVGPSEGAKGREILVDEAMAQERLDEVLGER
ncbi:MAG: DNA translocase FtsK [Synergistaceae bacterium]|nr:DNA translocase FtsK [Synergistaceae bacterium]